MFTGIVEEIGRVTSVVPGAQATIVTIATTLDPGPLGSSLAVSGVCLTITASGAGTVQATVGPETLQRTTLGGLRAGHRVNLERALRLSDRLGGHLVAGHVDEVGHLAARRQVGSALELDFTASRDLLRYVVVKGSIAVDGVSLTVNRLESETFGVTLIPHTLGATTLADQTVGAAVNLEADLIAKYVERLLGERAAPGGVTLELLAQHGYV